MSSPRPSTSPRTPPQVHIAERHLIPRLLAEHGLQQGQLVQPPGARRAGVLRGARRAALLLGRVCMS